MHRRRGARGGRHATHGARSDRVSHGRRGIAQAQRGRWCPQQRARSRERRGVRLGEREPAAFRTGGQIADGRGPGLASPADYAHGAARSLARSSREGRRRHQGRSRVHRALAAGATLLAMPTSLVTGGAGFLGSHLCDDLISRGQRVICVDNLETGSLENIRHLKNGADFRFEMLDITHHYELDEPVDFVYHMASPASPIDYARLPLHTLKVGAYGTHNTLGLAKKHRARFLLASTSEVYGDPLVHPQPETYWGNVNPIGPRGVYDEAKRYAEALTMAYLRQQGVN